MSELTERTETHELKESEEGYYERAHKILGRTSMLAAEHKYAVFFMNISPSGAYWLESMCGDRWPDLFGVSHAASAHDIAVAVVSSFSDEDALSFDRSVRHVENILLGGPSENSADTNGDINDVKIQHAPEETDNEQVHEEIQARTGAAVMSVTVAVEPARIVRTQRNAKPAGSVTHAAQPDEDLRWQDDALCSQVDPEAFFPEKGGSTRQAKKICKSCEVREECLEYALETSEQFGIWGGFSARERRKLEKQRVKTAELA